VNKKRQLITIDEAKPAQGQHTKPCSDCPWSRKSLPGWLGGESVADWLAEAHGNHEIPCHTLAGAQCAGAAIYRRNVCKLHVNDGVLLLEADRERVFATPMEFKRHHERTGVQGTPTVPTETVMPKAETIAFNLKLTEVKKKHDEKLASIAAKHAAALLKKDVAAKRAADKAQVDFEKVSAALVELSDILGGVSITDGVLAKGKAVEALKKKLGAKISKALAVTAKYRPKL
jgi:hypothetical protein